MRDKLAAALMAIAVVLLSVMVLALVALAAPPKTVKLRSGCGLDPFDLKAGYYVEVK